MTEEMNDRNPFQNYLLILTPLGITADDALQRMWETYEEAITNYTVESIFELFISNYIANVKKYEELIEFYKENLYLFGDYYRNENYDYSRTSNSESQSNSSGNGSVSTKNNQSRSSTTTPGVQSTTTHSVNPYDNSGVRVESTDVLSETGSNTTTESYTGSPDLTSSTSTAASTTQAYNTDRNVYDKIVHGRKGDKPTSEVIADGLKAAAMHDVLDIIISDIADQVFLQVWF